MRMIAKFDHWVESGPFTSADLGIYRIIYALGALLIAPDIGWLGQYPDFMFHAPPGPLQLLSGFPSPTALIVLEVLRSAALILLALGLWTRYASIAAALMLSLTYGLTYCLGKVDHTILVVLVPLVLAFANWGDRFSIDASQRSGNPSPQRQWPLRLFALLVGLGFFAAALTKLATGWLSFSSQAARGYFVVGFLTEGRTYWLAEWVAAHDLHPAWELVDWLTVILEFSILLTFPWWRAFRITLAIAATFHLGVLLVMNIDFGHAVLAYGAFVSWAAVAKRLGSSKVCKSIAEFIEARPELFVGAGARLCVWLFAAVVGAGAWFLMISPAGKGPTGPVCSNLIIVIGAVVGLLYLGLEVRTAVQKPSRILHDVGRE
jgi:vitamin K-dependent gamma-carboxylase-like protein